MKIATYILSVLLFGAISGWIVSWVNLESAISDLQEENEKCVKLLAGCKQNSIIFDKKVKKSNLDIKQIFDPIVPSDSCVIDTIAVVETYFAGKKRREVIKFWKNIKD